MFVRKIKSNKGIIEVGRYGISRIYVHEDNMASCYTAGGNIFIAKVKKILNDTKLSPIPGTIIKTYTDFHGRTCPIKQPQIRGVGTWTVFG